MFIKMYDNRIMSSEGNSGGGGSNGDDIIISGDVANSSKSIPPNPPNPPLAGDKNPPVQPRERTADTDLVDIKEDSDVLLKEYVSENYDDLSTVKLNKTGDLVNLEGTVLVKKADLDASLNTIKEDTGAFFVKVDICVS